ncbi:MAG: viologen exporter family transport system permease protein, partial [Clostridiales bacterium]|nr:viologen exporter family transport system permease protein [Clostridiales bacterium]MDN5281848.1 viologen exporter family transport system permease protein [Candidatus Ozemobacter sp.]
ILWKATIIQAMEYRVSFLFSILANFIDFTFGFLQYIVFFTAAKSIAGWNSDQILTLYGVFMCIFSLHFILLYPNLIEMGEMVNRGSLDLLLTKPVNSQLILSFKRISLEELGSFGASLALLTWLAGKGVLQLNIATVAQFISAMLGSMALVYSLFMILMSLAVKLEKLENMSQLMWSLFSFCRYPMEIYPGWLKHMFYTLFPIAFVSTVPASAILGRASIEITILGIIIALIAFAGSTFFWRHTIRAYTSAGG